MGQADSAQWIQWLFIGIIKYAFQLHNVYIFLATITKSEKTIQTFESTYTKHIKINLPEKLIDFHSYVCFPVQNDKHVMFVILM